MKKTSIVVKEKDSFEIDILINNTAYIKSVTGKTGLLNIKNNKIIGEMDNYYTIYDSNNAFYYQEKTIEESSKENNWKSKKTVRIYDAQKEKILVDLKNAMKNQNKDLLSVVRMVKGAVQMEEIKLKHELSDDEVIGIIKKYIKGVEETIKVTGKQTDEQTFEMETLGVYLPKMATKEEIKEWISQNIDLPENPQARMKCMRDIMAHFGKTVDGNTVKTILMEM